MALYVFDVGNTIKKNGNISIKNITEINNLKTKKNIICIATFRPIDILEDEIFKIRFDYLITLNGAIIYDNNREIIYKCSIENTYVKEIKDFVLKNNLHIGFYEENISYCPTIKDYEEINRKKFPIQKIIQNHHDTIYSIAIVSDEEFKLTLDLNIYYWEYNTKCNITSRHASKDKAVEFIHKIIELSWKSTYYFGDGPNDKRSIQLAKYGVAMNNSHPDTLKIAKIIINNDDGKGIYRYLSNIN